MADPTDTPPMSHENNDENWLVLSSELGESKPVDCAEVRTDFHTIRRRKYSHWVMGLGLPLLPISTGFGLYHFFPSAFDQWLAPVVGYRVAPHPDAVMKYEEALRTLRADTTEAHDTATQLLMGALGIDGSFAAAKGLLGWVWIIRGDAYRSLGMRDDTVVPTDIAEESGRLISQGNADLQAAVRMNAHESVVSLVSGLAYVRDPESFVAAKNALEHADASWGPDMPGVGLLLPWREVLRAGVYAHGHVEPQKVRLAYEAALRSDAQFIYARYVYSQWLESQKDIPSAIVQLEEILKIEPTHALAKRLLARLRSVP